MKILDATCGQKSIWYQKNHPFVTFMDIRKGKFFAKSKYCKLKDTRTVVIKPDVVSEWKDAPFPDEYFDMIIFDPPHKIAKEGSEKCAMEIRYGRLHLYSWKQDIRDALDKLFNILKPEGVFILKWCDTDKSVDEILKLFPYPPLFGTRTGQANKNHWILFLKYDVNLKLDELIT